MPDLEERVAALLDERKTLAGSGTIAPQLALAERPGGRAGKGQWGCVFRASY